jgi:DNA repair protein RadD
MLDLFTQTQPIVRKQLRKHQFKGIAMVRGEFRAGYKRVVMGAGTGFGKTLTAATLIEGAAAKGNRVLFTVPAISLIDQSVKAFEAEGVTGIGVLQANHPRTDPLAPIQVASVQTLARREIPQASLVIVDECHINSEVINKLMIERPDLYFVGLSATPWAKGMGLRWQKLVIPIHLDELIEQGYLSEFKVYAPDLPDLSDVKTRGGDYVESDLETVMSKNKLVANVVHNWLQHGENRPTLCFAVNRAHAAILKEAFEKAGVASGYCDAFTDPIERKILERQFRSGEIKVVCSVRTLTTGVDWPVSCIIDAAPTKSEILHVQKIGRGLRINEGTEDLVIFDHASNSQRLGFVTDIKHHVLDCSQPGEKQASKARPDRLPTPCSTCEALHTGLKCPYCGHERKPIAGVETVEGELILLKGKPKVATKEEKQLFFSMALWVCHQRGRKPGWAANLYRDKFQVWPRGMEETPIAPDQAFLNFEKSRRIAFAKRNEKRAQA